MLASAVRVWFGDPSAGCCCQVGCCWAQSCSVKVSVTVTTVVLFRMYHLKLYEASQKDGGPDVYAKRASHYDEWISDNVKHLAFTGGWGSVASKWQSYHQQLRHDDDKPHKLFDARCGTGLVCVELKKVLGSSSHLVEMHGGDLSPDML